MSRMKVVQVPSPNGVFETPGKARFRVVLTMER